MGDKEDEGAAVADWLPLPPDDAADEPPDDALLAPEEAAAELAPEPDD